MGSELHALEPNREWWSISPRSKSWENDMKEDGGEKDRGDLNIRSRRFQDWYLDERVERRRSSSFAKYRIDYEVEDKGCPHDPTEWPRHKGDKNVRGGASMIIQHKCSKRRGSIERQWREENNLDNVEDSFEDSKGRKPLRPRQRRRQLRGQ